MRFENDLGKRLRHGAGFGLLVMALWALAVPAMAAEKATLSISGRGSIAVAPDIASISIGVESQDKTADKALGDNNKAAAKIIDTLAGMGVDRRDIQTTNFAIAPVYADYNNRNAGEIPAILGYRVQNELHVRVRDLAHLGEMLDQVAAAGANRIGAIAFGLSDETTAADAARDAAVADARRKAKNIAHAAGVRLVRILRIDEQGGMPRPVGMAMMRMQADESVPIEQGETLIERQLSIVWEIAPANSN